MSIIERHLYMVAIRATLFRAKTNADTISTDVTYAPVTAISPLAIFPMPAVQQEAVLFLPPS